MSAFGGGMSTVPSDDIAQPAASSGNSGADPYAFEMSAFGAGAAARGDTKQSAMQADPYAFDMSAFGGNACADGAVQPSVKADLYAFDMSAFGGNAVGDRAPQSVETAETASDVDKQIGADLVSSSALSDPFYFDMSAFGGAGMVGSSEAHVRDGDENQGNDPFAADRGEPEQAMGANAAAAENDAPVAAYQGRQEQREEIAAGVEPFALSMAAFGMEDCHVQSAPGSLGSDPFASDRGVPEQATATAPATVAAADPFAFSMDAFGMAGSLEEPHQATKKQESDPSVEDRAVPGQATQASMSRAADLFTFSMEAFGLSAMQPEQVPVSNLPGQPGTNPFSANASILSGTLNPAVFGMGTLENPPAAPGSISDREPYQVPPRPETPGPSPPSRLHVEAPAPSASSQRAAASSAAAGQLQQIQGRQQEMERENEAAQKVTFDVPEPERFEPLSSAELQELGRLLRSAAGLPDLAADAGRPSETTFNREQELCPVLPNNFFVGLTKA
jgi:hypothetical protein